MQLIWRKKGEPSVRPADLFLTIRPDLVQSSLRKYTLGEHHVYGLVILIFLVTNLSLRELITLECAPTKSPTFFSQVLQVH